MRPRDVDRRRGRVGLRAGSRRVSAAARRCSGTLLPDAAALARDRRLGQPLVRRPVSPGLVRRAVLSAGAAARHGRGRGDLGRALCRDVRVGDRHPMGTSSDLAGALVRRLLPRTAAHRDLRVRARSRPDARRPSRGAGSPPVVEPRARRADLARKPARIRLSLPRARCDCERPTARWPLRSRACGRDRCARARRAGAAFAVRQSRVLPVPDLESARGACSLAPRPPTVARRISRRRQPAGGALRRLGAHLRARFCSANAAWRQPRSVALPRVPTCVARGRASTPKRTPAWCRQRGCCLRLCRRARSRRRVQPRRCTDVRSGVLGSSSAVPEAACGAHLPRRGGSDTSSMGGLLAAECRLRTRPRVVPTARHGREPGSLPSLDHPSGLPRVAASDVRQIRAFAPRAA